MTIIRFAGIVLLYAAVLPNCLSTQNSAPGKQNFVARISYQNSYSTDGSNPRLSPRICFELYNDGRYRMSRMMGGTDEALGGKLSQDQVELFMKTLKRIDFASNKGGVIRKGSESFAAEIANGGETDRYIWVDPDHQQPFPQSAIKVIDLLREFSPAGASKLTVPELSTDPICPILSDKPLQPVS